MNSVSGSKVQGKHVCGTVALASARGKAEDGMGTPKNSLTTKQRFVDETYQLIREEGLEHVTIRELGRRLGCTAPTLYKHFESLDFLVLVASMRFLEAYLQELADIESRGSGYVQQNLDAWYAFNRYAFANPPVFLHLFWGPYSSQFEDAVVEYFHLFPNTQGYRDEKFLGYLYVAAYRGNIQERDLVLLRHGVTEGSLTYDDAVYLSHVDCYIVSGMLREHMADYKDPVVAEKAAKDCNELLTKTVNAFLIK